MNVVITNNNQAAIQGLNLDIIKEMNGEFEVDEIVSTFKNFFFQRMILDVTAIKDYRNLDNLQKLSIALDMEKLILYLGNADLGNQNEFISSIISMGIYNFTKNADGIMYLYNNPNTYRDVAHFHNLSAPKEMSQHVPNTPNQPEQTAVPNNKVNARVVGIENITDGAGATTMIYLMKKQLSTNYSTVAIEVNKRDFTYFPEKDMYSTNNEGIQGLIYKHSDKEIILVDVNESPEAKQACDELVYLIEPSVIKLNKLMALRRRKLQLIKDKSVVLNKSVLSSKDVSDFEFESKAKVLLNIPPLDDRARNIKVVNLLLKKLGFDRQHVENDDESDKKMGLFNI